MTKNIFLLLSFSLILFSCSRKIDYAAADNFITESEKSWAKAISLGDTLTIKKIMSEDFVGMNSSGKTYDKKTLLKESIESANLFTEETYNIRIKYYGTTAIAQGGETWTKLSDSTSRKSVWTDTWIHRNSKWELIAAMDLKSN